MQGPPDARLRSFFFVLRAVQNSADFDQRRDVDKGSSQKGRLVGTRMTACQSVPLTRCEVLAF